MNPVALITGAGQGIGRATAQEFSKRGYSVILAGRTTSHLQETAKLCQGRTEIITVDLGREDELHQCFRQITQTFGRLDAAVNNAGIEGAIGPIGQLTSKDFDEVFDINVRGLFLCNQAEIAMMAPRKQGSIVNVSSIAGTVGFAGSSIYCASKHAVIGLSKALALEYAAQGLRINAICPAGVATAMLERIYHGDLKPAAAGHPIGRIAEPHEIAQAIAWLCSADASFVLGHSLMIDGGFTAQ